MKNFLKAIAHNDYGFYYLKVKFGAEKTDSKLKEGVF